MARTSFDQGRASIPLPGNGRVGTLDPVSAKQIARIGAAVTGWLLGTAVFAVNDRFDELWQPSD